MSSRHSWSIIFRTGSRTFTPSFSRQYDSNAGSLLISLSVAEGTPAILSRSFVVFKKN